MTRKLSGNQIRQTFIDFFVEHGHTVVPSASLVPGGDATLLFTNSGMVQFKDVFLGTDKRPYKRAVDSQKCMRVAGKHNDLDDVGRDDTHHTFFEMLGNWSFGDYYKKEAIAWSWQLLTDVWGLPKDKLYATCFKDDKGNIPTDDEAAGIWANQPGMRPENILFFGRKENFWQMAEFGPCGPCSEIHMDLGEERDNLRGQPHVCGVNGECTRFLELWNNVFIQYNMLENGSLEPLPATHVDTGMGFERLVSVLQGVDSNYKTDLFAPMIEVIRKLSGYTNEQVDADFTPFRVIADHTRAAAFLIADGVVPGNTGRNYVCRMIIRRAARFATKIGLHEPFMAQVALPVIEAYGSFYPELVQHKASILDSLTREEIRFARTVESGTAYLQGMLDELKREGGKVLDGHKAFDLYQVARKYAQEEGSGHRGGTGIVDVGIAALLYEWNDLEAALAHMRQGLKLIPLWSKADDIALAHTTLSRIQQAQGNTAAAEESIGYGSREIHSIAVFSEARDAVTAAEIRLRIAQGNGLAAGHWTSTLEKRLRSGDPFRFEHELAQKRSR